MTAPDEEAAENRPAGSPRLPGLPGFPGLPGASASNGRNATVPASSGGKKASVPASSGGSKTEEVSDISEVSEATEVSETSDVSEVSDEHEVIEGGGEGGEEAADLESRWRDSATSRSWQPPGQRQHRRRVRAVAGLVAVVFLAAVVYGAYRLYNDEQLASARSSALSAGKADAALISTYSYKNFPSYSKKIVANSTKQFADNYTKDAGSLGTILTQYQAASKGDVIGAGLGSGTTTSKATVYVFLNETVSNSKNPSQSERARMVVSLVRHGGRWIISNAVVE